MDVQLLVFFILLNIVNVIIQTVKSLATIKCGKAMAALANAVAYGLYTVVVVYMVCDLPLSFKVLVIALCNLVGVFVVKWGEEKARKDKLWKIEATVHGLNTKSLHHDLKKQGIPHNYISDVGKYSIFNIYCESQKESKLAREVLKANDAKYFVSETKIL